MKVLPLFGLFVQDRIKKENTLLSARIPDLESRMSEFQYCGVWHDRAYKRGNFVTYDGSVWHCNVDTCTKLGADPIVWTLAVKHGKDYTPRLPIKCGPRPQPEQRRT